jgi:hypothetical protein
MHQARAEQFKEQFVVARTSIESQLGVNVDGEVLNLDTLLGEPGACNNDAEI